MHFAPLLCPTTPRRSPSMRRRCPIPARSSRRSCSPPPPSTTRRGSAERATTRSPQSARRCVVQHSQATQAQAQPSSPSSHSSTTHHSPLATHHSPPTHHSLYSHSTTTHTTTVLCAPPQEARPVPRHRQGLVPLLDLLRPRRSRGQGGGRGGGCGRWRWRRGGEGAEAGPRVLAEGAQDCRRVQGKRSAAVPCGCGTQAVRGTYLHSNSTHSPLHPRSLPPSTP